MSEALNESAFPSNHIEAVVFDVIGTLVDEDTTWADAANRIVGMTDAGEPAELHRRWAEQLAHSMDAIISGRELWRPHGQLVGESADHAITSMGGRPTPETSELVFRLDSTYRAWPDVAEAITALRRGHLIAGVSNGDLDSLARLSNTNSISWDIALSTGTVHTFKPAPAAYQYAISALAIDPERTLFVASHPWDLRAAAGHGFRTAYVGRPGAQRPSREDRFDLEVADLMELPAFLS
jgi:2-haloacid dehalogenase